jgi:hypothetical protein
MLSVLLVLVLFGWLTPKAALATQVHVEPEGLYAHQLAHLFFAFSMGFLIYWLREHKLVGDPGWRYIQYSALFFILWNIDAMAVHFLDGHMDIIQVTYLGLKDMRVSAAGGSRGLELFYYVFKLDHLLCVPAMLFLWLGLRRLLHGEQSRIPGWRP